ncbi:MAG: pyridoxal phosphate-dependent aminotransferase, partial [bacterium]|nr:pyridoxal phosphate-dependent aminotransferase [bacterium]
MEISQRTQDLKPSATLVISATAGQLKDEGKDVVNLSAGQPHFSTPDYIKDAGKEALDKNQTKYTPVPGSLDFKKAIQNKFKRDSGLDYELNEIIVGTGGKQIIFGAVQALVNPGDDVILPVPYWVSYPPMVHIAGANSVFVQTDFENNFLLTPDQLKKAVTPKTKLIILTTPSNPTGMMYNKETLIELGNICLENGIAVISDEIYEYITFDGKKHHSFASLDPEFKKITITGNGLSKAYAMTGWRIGFGGGPQKVIAAMTRYQGHSTSNASSIAQYAGITAVNTPPEEVTPVFKDYEKKRDIAYERLSAIEGVETLKPDGAYYIFPKVSAYYGKSCDGF